MNSNMKACRKISIIGSIGLASVLAASMAGAQIDAHVTVECNTMPYPRYIQIGLPPYQPRFNGIWVRYLAEVVSYDYIGNSYSPYQPRLFGPTCYTRDGGAFFQCQYADRHWEKFSRSTYLGDPGTNSRAYMANFSLQSPAGVLVLVWSSFYDGTGWSSWVPTWILEEYAGYAHALDPDTRRHFCAFVR